MYTMGDRVQFDTLLSIKYAIQNMYFDAMYLSVQSHGDQHSQALLKVMKQILIFETEATSFLSQKFTSAIRCSSFYVNETRHALSSIGCIMMFRICNWFELN